MNLRAVLSGSSTYLIHCLHTEIDILRFVIYDRGQVLVITLLACTLILCSSLSWNHRKARFTRAYFLQDLVFVIFIAAFSTAVLYRTNYIHFGPCIGQSSPWSLRSFLKVRIDQGPATSALGTDLSTAKNATPKDNE